MFCFAVLIFFFLFWFHFTTRNCEIGTFLGKSLSVGKRNEVFRIFEMVLFIYITLPLGTEHYHKITIQKKMWKFSVVCVTSLSLRSNAVINVTWECVHILMEKN